MTAQTPGYDAHQVVVDLMKATDAMAPIFDAADGMRADLQRRGWSPASAEQIAQAWLMSLIYGMSGVGRHG